MRLMNDKTCWHLLKERTQSYTNWAPFNFQKIGSRAMVKMCPYEHGLKQRWTFIKSIQAAHYELFKKLVACHSPAGPENKVTDFEKRIVQFLSQSTHRNTMSS